MELQNFISFTPIYASAAGIVIWVVQVIKPRLPKWAPKWVIPLLPFLVSIPIAVLSVIASGQSNTTVSARICRIIIETFVLAAGASYGYQFSKKIGQYSKGADSNEDTQGD